jgi:intermediate cleaving peptidase 55
VADRTRSSDRETANDGSGDNHVFHLYVREKDRKAELWDGARSGTQAAKDVFNADEVSSNRFMIDDYTNWNHLQTGDIEQIKEILPPIVSEATEIYTDIRTFDRSQSVLSRYLYGTSGESEIQKIVGPRKVKALRPILNDLRVFKSDSEVVNLRKVGQASGRAFTEAMRMDFNTEKDLSTFIQSFFRMNGCDGSAFVPVVAGGRVRIPVLTKWTATFLTSVERIKYPLYQER